MIEESSRAGAGTVAYLYLLQSPALNKGGQIYLFILVLAEFRSGLKPPKVQSLNVKNNC